MLSQEIFPTARNNYGIKQKLWEFLHSNNLKEPNYINSRVERRTGENKAFHFKIYTLRKMVFCDIFLMILYSKVLVVTCILGHCLYLTNKY